MPGISTVTDLEAHVPQNTRASDFISATAGERSIWSKNIEAPYFCLTLTGTELLDIVVGSRFDTVEGCHSKVWAYSSSRGSQG